MTTGNKGTHSMRRLLLATALAATPFLAQAMPAITDPNDPQLWVGPPGSTSAPGGTAIGHESNLLTGSSSTGTTMVFGVQGNHDLQSPLLVIFAEPTAATIS